MIEQIIVLALFVESTVEYVKTIFVKGKIHWAQIGAIALGVFIAFAANVDLFAAVNIPFAMPYVGTACSGVVISRGANYVSDFASMIWKVITGNKAYGEQTETASSED